MLKLNYYFLISGATNILFGFLEWVEDSTSFLALSLSIRIVSAIGESAFFCAIYPLATKVNISLTILSTYVPTYYFHELLKFLLYEAFFQKKLDYSTLFIAIVFCNFIAHCGMY